jgi:transposase
VQSIGLSRGGSTTKIHALTDVIGCPFVVMLTPGNVADVSVAPTLIERAQRVGYLIGDRGCDADHLRATIRARGGRPVIPGKANRNARSRSTKLATSLAISSRMPSAA